MTHTVQPSPVRYAMPSQDYEPSLSMESPKPVSRATKNHASKSQEKTKAKAAERTYDYDYPD